MPAWPLELSFPQNRHVYLDHMLRLAHTVVKLHRPLCPPTNAESLGSACCIAEFAWDRAGQDAFGHFAIVDSYLFYLR